VNFGNRAQSLADLVDCQAGSVVSRPLLSRSAGSITLFAFDKDLGLSEHTTRYDALALSLDGELDITIAGDRRRPSREEVLPMPANKPHEVHANSRSKRLLVMVRE
jgi:quercetin dioxygenase-like cupin family protein